MERIEAYQASDGSLFKTVDECQDHEFSLVWRQRIDEFCNSTTNPYPNGAQMGMVKKTVLAWERFKTGA